MELCAIQAPPDRVSNLPTPARPRLDPADTVAPDGYDVEVVVASLSFPTGMGFADDGTLYILEGGSTWPTRPTMLPRILQLDPSGAMRVFAVDTLGGPRGVSCKDGYVYTSSKGGYQARITRWDRETGKGEILIDQIPSGGWHEPGGFVFSPRDGLMYFAHGSVSQNGVVLPQGFTVDLAKHPMAHDIPGVDITLTGNNIYSRDPLMPYPYLTETGPFKRFGEPAAKGEVVKGQLWCTSGFWRCRPDGTDVELLAWGLRNPYGMAFSEDGELYVSDNDLEEKGEGRWPATRTASGGFGMRARPTGRCRRPTGTASRSCAPTVSPPGIRTTARRRASPPSRSLSACRSGRDRRPTWNSRTPA